MLMFYEDRSEKRRIWRKGASFTKSNELLMQKGAKGLAFEDTAKYHLLSKIGRGTAESESLNYFQIWEIWGS